MRSIQNIFSEEELLTIRELPEVSAAYQRLSIQSSAYFSIPATDLIKQRLSESFGLNLEALSQIPCRWIKGDTPAHIDRGQRSFEDTYLVYLTDGEGEFHIDTESYSIQAGTGFSFSEGVSHEVVNTNGSARLLLGPMSEFGFAVGVGGISADGATTTVYIYEEDNTLYLKYNDSEPYMFDMPVYISNTNADPGLNSLKVIFTSNITLTSTLQYFICFTDGIQFGSTSLDSQGNKANIVIDGVEQYPGVFQNGTSGASGYSNISIYNLSVSAANDAYLITGGGWLAQSYFGKDAINNYIINCASDGPIESFGGGIVGLYAAYKDTATSTSLQVIGCNSTGIINTSAGGIVGARCGYGSGGSCIVEQCWSLGELSSNAGGIVGQYAGQNSGSVTISKCYSTGGPTLGNNSGGGICGSFAGYQSGVVAVEKSYSTGNIMQDGGGIYGAFAGDTSGITSASNCYSSGTITTSGTGIFGSDKETGVATNCYSANGSWSDSTANTNLTGVPIDGKPGNTWSPVGLNEPYELVAFGATPYQLNTIDANSLIQTYSQSVIQGASSNEAVSADASGNAFSILQISGGDSGSYTTITISAQTGKISTTSQTVVGTYSLTVRSIGSYYITTFLLSVTAYVSPSEGEAVACCKSTMDERGLPYEWINDYRIGNRLIAEHAQNPNLKFNGYSEYVKYKMAQAQRRS